MINTKLYKNITSNENIFAAIYSLESYIFERNLLSKADLELYYSLKDKHNKQLIIKTIEKCKTMLCEVLLTDKRFDVQVYFKMKKYNSEERAVECRPMHTANLITQICIVCLLNKIMFRETKNKERELSHLTQLLPSNFYGNMPSATLEEIFYDWKNKYKEYSDNIIKTYDIAKETGNYKYEVTLDLSKYFPSIDPNIIFNYAMQKLAVTYTGNEFEMLKKVFEKLLIFNINNLSTDEATKRYYGENKVPDKHITVGVPQGLPQSYYFGNICMIIISQEFAKVFPGEAFYYVDDSVIYTNSENAKDKNFKESLINLNQQIMTALYNFDDKVIDNSGFKYSIEVHTDEKSMSAEIATANKMSRALLMLYTLEASDIGRDLNSTIDSIEDHMLENKLDCLTAGLEQGIANVKDYIKKIEATPLNEASLEKKTDELIQKDSFDIYLKSLIRYKKFFVYRKKLLEFRNSKDINKTKIEFENKYFNKTENFSGSENDVKSILNVFQEDIFSAESQLIYSNLVSNEEKQKFKNSIKDFEGTLLNDLPSDLFYFSKTLENIVIDINIYESLMYTTKKDLTNYSKVSRKVALFKLKELLDENFSNNLMGYGCEYDSTIFKFSNEYKRRILNAVMSKLFNVELSDNVQMFTKDNRAIRCFELRLISFLRNRNCLIADFKKFAIELISDMHDLEGVDYEKVDFTIFEVLNTFNRYVQNPAYIDSLILVHKYVSSIWKNGSKFLYFYTLHNQEHSVELIKSVITICKSIDYLQLKTSDFYILFLSCYLHDISMVLQPSINEITRNNNETDILYTDIYEFIAGFDVLNEETVKNIIRISFEKASNYFEALSRDKHAYDSGKFIKSSFDLNFLDKPVRSFVANISEAHGYDSQDVYGLRSKAKNEIISEKCMKILLRIADLLDGSKDRVSLNILNQNIFNMPEISQYHWITHSAIDTFSITSKYEFVLSSDNNLKGGNTGFRSILEKDNLKETIVVNIRLNAFNLIGVESGKCKGIKAKLQKEEQNIKIIFNDSQSCDGSSCNFLCKWMCDKNNYLIKELSALQKYLNRNASNIFKTNIELYYIFENAKSLNSKFFDIVKNRIG